MKRRKNSHWRRQRKQTFSSLKTGVKTTRILSRQCVVQRLTSRGKKGSRCPLLDPGVLFSQSSFTLTFVPEKKWDQRQGIRNHRKGKPGHEHQRSSDRKRCEIHRRSSCHRKVYTTYYKTYYKTGARKCIFERRRTLLRKNRHGQSSCQIEDSRRLFKEEVGQHTCPSCTERLLSSWPPVLRLPFFVKSILVFSNVRFSCCF